MRRILLQDERMVHAVRLAASSADLNIMGETGLYFLLISIEMFREIIQRLPSLQHGEPAQSHYPAPTVDCSQESLATKIVQQLPSCGQSFPALALELLPIVMAPVQHHTPCMHG
jgi:hypothetical protein